MIDKLKDLTEKFIKIHENNPNELKKYNLIKEILNKKDCFLNMSIDYAYSILRDLEIPERELKEVYSQLISLEENDRWF